jgi:hypothetical protein
MGGLPLPRKNPFMARGLLPGTTLRMDVSSSETFVASVEGVERCVIAVLAPMRGRQAPHQPEPLE